MAVIQMSQWARMVAIAASYFMIMLGFVDVFYDDHWYEPYIGIYSMLMGAALFVWVWPWSLLRVAAWPFQQFWLAAPLCFVIAIPLGFVAPTVMAAGALGIAGIFYAVAAVKREKGQTSAQLLRGEMRPAPPRAE